MKQIEGFPNYLITSDGQVINSDTGKILKYDINSCNYKRVTLSKNGKTTRMFVHRLVAQHFIDNPFGYNQVNHIDGDKQNNISSNLEWCNQSLNQKHAYVIGLQIVKTKVSENQVRDICERLCLRQSVKRIWREVGATKDIVADIKRKKTWTHISKDYVF